MRFAGPILGLCMTTSAASGATFSYVGTPLSPAMQGGTGAKVVRLSFAAPRAPSAGKCVRALKLTKYADGAHTLGTLRRAGFQIIHSGDTGPLTFATVCLGADGTTVSGVYEITLSLNIFPFTKTFYVTNATGNATDLVEYLVYSGSVPSVSSDVSARAGTWKITP